MRRQKVYRSRFNENEAGCRVYAEKSISDSYSINQNQIALIIFRLILNQTYGIPFGAISVGKWLNRCNFGPFNKNVAAKFTKNEVLIKYIYLS